MGGMVGPGHHVVKQSDECDAPQNASALEKRDEVRVNPVVAEPVQRLDVEPPDANVEANDAVRV